MSSAVRPDRLTDDELQRLLRKAEPAALLVPPRILRRVIKKHKGLGGFGLAVPHRKSYLLDRDTLLQIATPRELGLAEGESLPETVLLLPKPEQHRPRDKELLRYWRYLFHLEVHRAFDRLRGRGQLDGPALHARIDRLGPVAFEEIRDVLRQEGLLFAPDDPAAVYEEFVAVYLELRHFDPEHLGHFFPALVDRSAVDQLLAGDVDSEALFQSTRLPGAPDPLAVPSEAAAPTELPPVEATTSDPGSIRVRAEQVARRGNQVRAALLLERAVAVSPPEEAVALHAGASAELDALAARLQRALGFPPEQRGDWGACLRALLPAASAARFWNAEVRLLYDLQKACVDMERPLFAADLVEWVCSFFRRPIKRTLPDQPLVLMVKHLRSALNRLPAARLPAPAREQLGVLLHEGIHAAERRMRLTFQPKILEALGKAGLTPRSVAEGFSRDQLVEELLDAIARRGTIGIGDLRDAIARSRLKLPDLSGPGEFMAGDALLRTDRALAEGLDGVYRRGEVYLRWLQSLGSVFFGTVAGRALSLYLILPFLGSLLILKGIDGLSEELHKYVGTPELPPTFNPWSFLALALFLLPMLHAPPFRRAAFTGLWYVWRGVRGVLYDLPAVVFRLPLLKELFQSRVYLLFYQFVGKPLLLGLPVPLVLAWKGFGWDWMFGAWVAAAVAASAVINSRLGAVVEETTADWLSRSWQLLRDDLLPGLFRGIVWLSRRFVERVEEVRYTVDEWLLFRRGESRLVFALKLAFGVPWFLLSYVMRFVIVVLFEPQVNPIKHFPVVTVSHKLMLLLAPPIAGSLAPQLGWKYDQTLTLVILVLGLIPGLFGFLAWELKENWRLYRANQPEDLEPAVIGDHGERVINFIRPGFHSGTVTKLFAKLRRATGKKRRRHEEALHHVAEEMRRFVGRELFAPLCASHWWPSPAALTLGEIRLATNRIRIEFCCPDLGADGCWLDFTNRGGRLVAGLPLAGWVNRLDARPRDVLVTALIGLYKRAGVDLVAEQLVSLFPEGLEYEIREGKLLVTAPGLKGSVAYDLEKLAEPAPGATPGLPKSAGEFLFRQRRVTWQAWVERWQRDQAGEPHQPPLLPDVRMLPGGAQ
jgi:hypothetical protein